MSEEELISKIKDKLGQGQPAKNGNGNWKKQEIVTVKQLKELLEQGYEFLFMIDKNYAIVKIQN